jgi:dTMP kinase
VWTGLNPLAELFLFAASRAQLVSEVICPHLEKGHIVICDRFTDSTLAYQGYGRGLEPDTIEAVNEIATSGLHPDLTILLDLEVEAGLARVRSSRRIEPFERESTAFHQRVREGYLKMAAADPKRWFVLDAMLPQQQIGGLIWERVLTLLCEKGYG